MPAFPDRDNRKANENFFLTPLVYNAVYAIFANKADYAAF